MTTADRPTGRTVMAYVQSVEAWDVNHEEARLGLELEELIGVGNKAFEAISDLDLNWHEFLVDSQTPYDHAIAAEIMQLHRVWADVSARLLAPIEAVRDRGYELKGRDSFLRNIAEARAVASGPPTELPDALVALRDEALAEHRAGETVEMRELGD